ncbi:Rab-like protein 2A [Coelomomyces lativittatus]|nr:Rab-like protein 2A [Coelomomyces lativittatus]KAJ1504573.1 Rab-like protein 2A [Coelomomyces lativittatus]KAJ1508884.1 Rab-like protein 2A [Coelomomyces lativittatus]
MASLTTLPIHQLPQLNKETREKDATLTENNEKNSKVQSEPPLILTMKPENSNLKIILLGDSAVGKSKLIERFLIQSYSHYTSSTRALSIYKYTQPHPITNDPINIDFYDTAGQERFASMHAGYYYSAHACLLCFDLTRKTTYKNLNNWYNELRHHRPNIPVIVLANKVDEQKDMAGRDFKFALDNQLEVIFVSACDGTNVLHAFQEIIKRAIQYKESDQRDFMDDVLELLAEDNNSNIQGKE